MNDEKVRWPNRGADYYKALADARAAVVTTVSLTPTQAEEVEHGLDVDRDEGRPAWGVLRRSGKRTADLDVLDLDAALYRITSGRDVLLDGADNAWTLAPERRLLRRQVVSMQALIDHLVASAGGPDNLDPETRRWL